MSADTNQPRDTFGDQLEQFDDKLSATANDVDMLADIQDGIGQLLASSSGGEGEIRRVLQERYDSGALRKETFQLVKSMLDRYVTENIPTSPELPGLDGNEQHPLPETLSTSGLSEGDDAFGSTTVIPVDEVPEHRSESPVQIGSILRDRFLLQEQVAGGSMGVVYKALDRRLAEAGSDDHWVAIKVLSPGLAENAQALRALQQEAAKGRCLVHPNIVRFIDLDRDDDLYFLVMEWLEGRTLANILDSKDAGSIDHETSRRIVREIGEALDYAHKCGIVHADIKPGNIMITPGGRAKLFDFGVARVQQQQTKADFDPGVLGAVTPAYSSMQVLTGEPPAPSDDVFSLACLMYRLIAGHRVFGPRNAAEASEKGMAPQRVRGISDGEWKALKKALSYSRVTRFQSIDEFLDALTDQDDDTISLDASERLAPEFEDTPRRLWPWVLLLGLVAGGAAYQQGFLDDFMSRLSEVTSLEPITVESVTPPIEDVTDPATIVDEAIDGMPATAEPEPEQVEIPVEEVVGPDPMLVDFSRLAPPTHEISVPRSGRLAETVDIALREDGSASIIDFIRNDGLTGSLELRLEEVGFSGNRSPWSTGQYSFSDDGVVWFPQGQERARVTLTMASDPLREADQLSTLVLREADLVDSRLVTINVSLEDDDQRSFEAGLPADTVAFAASQASIRETDPAVQIDLVRFNPSRAPLTVAFSVSDITATDGEDYFAPGSYSITFGPSRRSARLLIPLVQDAEAEGDEAFVVELLDGPESAALDIYRRIVVMIRDDDSNTP
ncbi:MAG: protein kinase [Gammaproteobacteria bacterium]|nr:protein kinase [Gammaproteobacteria bacterium]